MKKLLVSTALASTIFLGSCDATKDIPAFITAVQQNVVNACAFAGIVIPQAEAVASIFLLANPALQSVEQVVGAIVAVLCPPHPPAAGAAATSEPLAVGGVKINVIKIPK